MLWHKVATFKDNVKINDNNEFIHCNFTIINSTFINNEGRLLYARKYVVNEIPLINALTIIGCEFRNNNASAFNSMIDVYYSDILIYDTKFISNKAVIIFYAEKSVINTDNCTFKYNNGSAMDLSYCKVNIFNSVFNNNDASALNLQRTTIHIHGSEFKENHIEKGLGGVEQFILQLKP